MIARVTVSKSDGAQIFKLHFGIYDHQLESTHYFCGSILAQFPSMNSHTFLNHPLPYIHNLPVLITLHSIAQLGILIRPTGFTPVWLCGFVTGLWPLFNTLLHINHSMSNIQRNSIRLQHTLENNAKYLFQLWFRRGNSSFQFTITVMRNISATNFISLALV